MFTGISYHTKKREMVSKYGFYSKRNRSRAIVVLRWLSVGRRSKIRVLSEGVKDGDQAPPSSSDPTPAPLGWAKW